jgi:hypothetical protein
MTCPQCRHDNPAGAKFCEECAEPLSGRCGACGHTLSLTAKFCPECAHPVGPGQPGSPHFGTAESYTPRHLAEKILTTKSALEGERKQVTVLFADLKGSLELLAERDPEEARALLDPILEHMMEAVHRFEGTVNQVMGDGIMALFGAPLAHEDHAVRACYAALRMQETVRRLQSRIDTPASSCCIIRAVSGSRSRNAATDGNVASPPIVGRTRGRRTCTRRPPKVRAGSHSVAAVCDLGR